VYAKVESGIIKEKDEVILMPHNVIASIKGIEISKKRVKYAFPGSLCEIALHMPTSFDPTYIKSGNVLCDPKYPIH
jgi:translation elongation factor EF-1alpha